MAKDVNSKSLTELTLLHNNCFDQILGQLRIIEIRSNLGNDQTIQKKFKLGKNHVMNLVEPLLTIPNFTKPYQILLNLTKPY